MKDLILKIHLSFMVVTLILIEIIGAVILYLVLSVVGWLIVNPLIDRRVYGKIPDDWFHFRI